MGCLRDRVEAPELQDRIKAGHFPHGRRGIPYKPMPLAPSFQMLPVALQELFLLCFEVGHGNPAARPTAEVWSKALGEAEDGLVTCGVNGQHHYSGHLGVCPWCERAVKLGGRDPFPALGAIPSTINQNNSRSPKVFSVSTQPVISQQLVSSQFSIINPTTYTSAASHTSSLYSQSLISRLKIYSNKRKIFLVVSLFLIGSLSTIVAVNIASYLQQQSLIEQTTQLAQQLKISGQYVSCLDTLQKDAQILLIRKELADECSIGKAKSIANSEKYLDALNELKIISSPSLRSEVFELQSKWSLQFAEKSYYAGNFKDAIDVASSISNKSYLYTQSQFFIQNWKNEWNFGEAQFYLVQKAFDEERWQNVIDEANKIENIPYWNNRVRSILENTKTIIAELKKKQEEKNN